MYIVSRHHLHFYQISVQLDFHIWPPKPTKSYLPETLYSGTPVTRPIMGSMSDGRVTGVVASVKLKIWGWISWLHWGWISWLHIPAKKLRTVVSLACMHDWGDAWVQLLRIHDIIPGFFYLTNFSRSQRSKFVWVRWQSMFCNPSGYWPETLYILSNYAVWSAVFGV
jgi:hypothetical protein